MYISVIGIEVVGKVPEVDTSWERVRSAVEMAATPKVPIEKFMSPRGSLRYMDPVALWIAELAGASDVDVSDCELHYIGLGATRHYFEVTRRLLAGEAFSPLAYSNRSCNAVAAQVSQLLGMKTGAAAYGGSYCRYILNALRRRIRKKGPVLICGGRIRSASTPHCFFGPDQGVDYCYCFKLSETNAGGTSQWRISLDAQREDDSGQILENPKQCTLLPTSPMSLGQLSPLIIAALYGACLGNIKIRVFEDAQSHITLSPIN
ncbi:hypothetical protein MO327_18730 [Xanthomonas translucens]|uniref:hypothetical protein n=1 Tax=Xanthomonas campestris pv. translucens TaxID=343 RepID=UPI00272AAF49|nr:hypothetical protein [Xanthomonas translucens]WLA12157.1 hypothetical protein MO327_18730 [Xanthomonas translucens]